MITAVIHNVTDVTVSCSDFVSYIIKYRLSEYTKYYFKVTIAFYVIRFSDGR